MKEKTKMKINLIPDVRQKHDSGKEPLKECYTSDEIFEIAGGFDAAAYRALTNNPFGLFSVNVWEDNTSGWLDLGFVAQGVVDTIQ